MKSIATDESPTPGPIDSYSVCMLGAAGVGKAALLSQFRTSECINAYESGRGSHCVFFPSFLIFYFYTSYKSFNYAYIYTSLLLLILPPVQSSHVHFYSFYVVHLFAQMSLLRGEVKKKLKKKISSFSHSFYVKASLD